MTGYVIYNDENGIFIGECLGMGFWSKLDPVGQPEAVAFENTTIAYEVIERFENYDKHYGFRNEYKIVPVEITSSHGRTHYASIQSCVQSGLPAW